MVDHMAKRLLWESTRLYVDKDHGSGVGSGAGQDEEPAIYGPCCVTIAAGMAPRRRAWCSIIDLGRRRICR